MSGEKVQQGAGAGAGSLVFVCCDPHFLGPGVTAAQRVQGGAGGVTCGRTVANDRWGACPDNRAYHEGAGPWLREEAQ